MLRLAARFISDKDTDTANVRKLIAGLDGIYVRSFKFAREGEYNMADVDALRAQGVGRNPILSRCGCAIRRARDS